MNFKILFSILLTFFLIFSTAECTVAQTDTADSELIFEHYGLKDGLPSNTVHEMVESDDGFLWFTTQNGIVRFDGVEFTNFTKPETDGIISSDLPYQILKDNDGGLWIGYQLNHYIAQYDSIAGDFIYRDLHQEVDVPGGILHTRLMGIDHKNRLWVALIRNEKPEEAWVMTIDTATGEIIKIYIDDDGNSLFEDGYFYRTQYAGVGISPFLPTDNGVWLGARDNVHFVDNDDNIHSYLDYPLDDSLTFGTSNINLVDEEVWVSSGGPFRFDEGTNSFQQIENLPEEIYTAMTYKTYQDSNGHVWITSGAGTVRIRPNGDIEEVSDREEFSHMPNTILFPESESEQYIWFVNKHLSPAANISDGITRYDKKQDQFTTTYGNLPDEDRTAPHRYITLIRETADGTIWIGDNYTGLYYHHPEHQLFSDIMAGEGIPEAGQNEYYSSIAESPDGLIWIGSVNGQIFTYNPASENTTLFHTVEPPEDQQGSDRNLIFDLHIQDDGTLWAATELSGLQRFRYNTESLQIIDTEIWMSNSGKDGYDLFRAVTMIEPKNSELWIGSGGGFAIFDYEEEQFRSYDTDADSFDPRYAYGTSSTITSDGSIWFFGEDGFGLKRIDPETREVTRYNEPGSVPDEHAFGEYDVDNIIEDQHGNILAAYDNIFLLDEEDGAFKPLSDNFNMSTTHLLEDPEGGYMLTTYGKGVYWFNLDGEITKQLNQSSGLANDLVTDAKLDQDGNLWTMHALGISMYDRDENRVINYGPSHGLTGAESENPFRLKTTKSGYFAPFYLSSSLAVFDPASVDLNSFNQPPKITGVSTSNGRLPIQAGDAVSIPHNFGELTFSFSSPQFLRGSMQEYRYRLNSDTEWSNWSTERNIQFAGLSPGSYSFQVQTRNSSREVHPAITEYQFAVIPPWYASNIAIALYILLGFGLMLTIATRYSNYRTKQINMRLRAEQAEELAKLDRIKTNLLTNISHELRTPLTLVMGPIEQLYDHSKELGTEWQHRLEIARRNGKRLGNLVEQVLDLTRLDSKQMQLNPKKVELNNFLKRTLESFDSMAERKQLNLSFSIPEHDVYASIDPDKFEKVIVNLLSNAMKFTPNKGSITLRLEEKEQQVEIHVTDTGKGINKEQQTHIFDRFQSTEETIGTGGKGLGVGLSIVKEFVELHQGSISVTSEPGSGSTFSVTIPKGEFSESEDAYPAGTDPSEVPDLAESSEKSIPGVIEDRPYTVLLVEDNEDMREYVSDLIESKSVRIEIAKNGLEGKKQLSVIKPDLIISDIMMPEMDGYEFTEYIRSVPEFRLTPIILLSARADVEDRIKGYSIGISDYLVKPFDRHELKARVKNLLDLKQERDKQIDESGGQKENYSEEVTFVAQLRNFVEDHISKSEITVEELSEQASVSRSQLYRKLKTATGFTPAEFVKEIRLNKARSILEQKQKGTIAEVAYDVGFSTPSYFSRLYKKRYGRSPGEYLR